MSRWLMMTFLLALPLAALAADPPSRTIDRKSPRLDTLLATDARVEELVGGFKWTEGPVWDKQKQGLYFSDIPSNTVRFWSDQQPDAPKDAVMLSVYLKPAGFTGTADFTGKEPGSNGLALDKDNKLILCQHGDRCIARLKEKKYEKGTFETLADKFEGKRFNSPNDLVILPDGDILFTDPPYGLPKGEKDPAKELDFQGVFRLKPNGEVKLLTKEMTRPNGIAVSPDGKVLYIANSDPEKAVWMSFPINADGSLGAGKVFFDATHLAREGKANPGLPDGMKVDVDGNLWATGPGGVLIFSAEGTHLGTIRTNTPTANCAWGDDGGTLYITANDRLIRIKTKAKGWK